MKILDILYEGQIIKLVRIPVEENYVINICYAGMMKRTELCFRESFVNKCLNVKAGQSGAIPVYFYIIGQYSPVTRNNARLVE